MNILALESSSEQASLALLRGDDCLERVLLAPPAHSATLLPALHTLLAEAGMTLAGLDVIACGIGPGAFTGVRLACSVAQGLALAAGKPVAAVCSLLALAEAQDQDEAYCAMDARMGELYAASYRRTAEGWQTVIEPCCVPPELAPLPQAGTWAGCGNAFAAYPALGARLAAQVSAPPQASVPAARAVARLAARQPWLDAAEIAPFYVRDRVALTVAERLAAGGRA